MDFYRDYKENAKDRLHSALIMLEQYTFKEALEWCKDGVDPIKGNTKTHWLKKCEDIVRNYINEKWSR